MLLFILLVIGTVVLDQLSKYWVLQAVAMQGIPTDIALQDQGLPGIGLAKPIENVLHFTYITNKGAAFGSLEDHRWVFMVISTVAILALIVYMAIARPKSRFEIVSLAFIAGGGIGNMIDRIFRGFVVDFIDVTCINFYVFNVADSFVCIGCGMMLLYLILAETAEHKAKKAAKAGEPSDMSDAPGN